MNPTIATTTTTTTATYAVTVDNVTKESQIDFFTIQLKQLMLEKDQLFQQYFELLSFDPITCKDKYKNNIAILSSKLAILKKRQQHIKFLLNQIFIQQAQQNNHKEWLISEEQQLVKSYFIDKIPIQKIALLHMRTPFAIENKIKQINKFYNSPFISEQLELELSQTYTNLKNNTTQLVNFSIKCQRSPDVIVNKIKQLEKDKLTSTLLLSLLQN